MKRWLYITGFFALGLLLGAIATKVSNKPVPQLLMTALGVVTIAFLFMLFYRGLQKRKRT